MKTKLVCMTGSPKSFGFSTKGIFISKLSEFGFEDGGKITKKNNKIDVLITDDLSSTTSKMILAKELNLEIMTYGDLSESFDIIGDI